MPRPTTDLRFVKSDHLVPHLAPGDHAYLIVDSKDNVLGIVASGATSWGRKSWTAARISPLRSVPFGQVMVHGDSREKAAAELLGAGA